MASQRNLPNIITLSRIAVCPAIFFLALSSDGTVLAATFALFLVAALSDVWDGYLARKHNLISDLGKLLDPIADKLLLVSTLVPYTSCRTVRQEEAKSRGGANSHCGCWWSCSGAS